MTKVAGNYGYYGYYGYTLTLLFLKRCRSAPFRSPVGWVARNPIYKNLFLIAARACWIRARGRFNH